MARPATKSYTKETVANIPAERVVLATVFHTNDQERIANLDEADFVDKLNSLLLRAMKELVAKGAPLEYIPLCDLLRTPDYEKSKALVEIRKDGAIADAVTLVLDEFINPANLEYYWRLLRQERLRRWLLKFSGTIHDKAIDRGMDPLETAKWAVKQACLNIKASQLEVEV